MRRRRMGYALLFVASALFVALVSDVASGGVGPSVPANGTMHDVYEQDRLMTEQMGIDVGPGMQSMMADDHMLYRSTGDAYMRGLERHACQVDRMLARGTAPCT